jgi:hypothetical protein
VSIDIVSKAGGARNGAAATPGRHDHSFYAAMAIAIAATVFAGFARTFYLRPYFEPTPLPAVIAVHGFVFSAWIGLFAVQTSLIAAGRPRWHRRLGWAGAALAVGLVVAGMAAAIAQGRRDIAAGYEQMELAFFATPVLALTVFATLVAAAVACRTRPQTHKRLMLLATISILDPAIGRWPVPGVGDSPLAYYGITDAFIVAAILYDVVSRRRVAPIYLWGGLLILIGQTAHDAIGATSLWQAFAAAILER